MPGRNDGRQSIVFEVRPWTEKAACDGMGDGPFFSDIWAIDPETGEEGEPDPEALHVARSVCARCPVRTECFLDVMEAEEGHADARRAGLRAWLTPSQRYSVWRRDAVRCIQCGEPYDPIGVVQGDIVCSCGSFMEPPIPDDGDFWYPRHDSLLEKLIRYLLESTKPGDRILPPYRMMRELGHRRKDDMPTCYDRLIEDGMITRGSRVGEYYRSGSHRALATWVPPMYHHRIRVGLIDRDHWVRLARLSKVVT